MEKAKKSMNIILNSYENTLKVLAEDFLSHEKLFTLFSNMKRDLNKVMEIDENSRRPVERDC